MYQTVGSNAVEYIAKALDKPLFRRPITGTAKLIAMEYEGDKAGDEVEDLYELVKEVKVNDRRIQTKYPDIEGVSSGAILSTYQKKRVENV